MVGEFSGLFCDVIFCMLRSGQFGVQKSLGPLISPIMRFARIKKITFRTIKICGTLIGIMETIILPYLHRKRNTIMQ
jgi:hypothetical protein